jgi:restriction system protein
MAIPDYESIMLPLLELAGDGQEHALRVAARDIADRFELTDDDRSALLPSGKSTIIYNRLGWARTYLAKAGLLDSSKRGWFTITERGREVLSSHPTRIDKGLLSQFSEFVEFKHRRNLKSNNDTREKSTPSQGAPYLADSTPEEQLEASYQTLRDELAAELLTTIKSGAPEFFERLVVDLLVRMGYGGSRREAGEAVGKSGDGGIDGIINEDRLGLDIIYVQAKRWEGGGWTARDSKVRRCTSGATRP